MPYIQSRYIVLLVRVRLYNVPLDKPLRYNERTVHISLFAVNTHSKPDNDVDTCGTSGHPAAGQAWTSVSRRTNHVNRSRLRMLLRDAEYKQKIASGPGTME